jgi:arylsulfatase A-like enzyme
MLMSLSRRDFVKLCGAYGAVSAMPGVCSAAAIKLKRKNVLFIAVDDLKPMLGCYGDETIKTPNIDRLAKSGLVCLNNHCQKAVCGPSRASLLTGLRPDVTKIWDLKTRMRDIIPDVVTIPQYFKQNGYHAGGMGKIFDRRCCDGDTQDKISWSEPLVMTNGVKYAIDRSNVSPEQKQPATECADVPDNGYFDGVLAETAVKRIEEYAKMKKPFFLAVGFRKPHLPFVAPKKYWDMFDRKQFKIHPFQEHSKNSPDIGYHNFNELRNGYSDISLEGDLSEEKQLELIHGYHASVSYVDAQVGKLLDTLKKERLDKNTIVVLWGDHGWHLGDHGLWCKHTNFEQATRSPLIFDVPGVKAKGKTSSPTEFVDIFPTLCEFAGLPVPEHLQGVSLKPLFKNPEMMVKNVAVSQFQCGAKIMGYAFRDRRYRYLVWQKKKFYEGETTGPIYKEALYDYEKDPMETVNVLDDPAYKEVLRRFKGLAEVRDTLNLDEIVNAKNG